MRCWSPEKDEPELLDWWRPLLAAAGRAREDEVPWPIHVDQFALLGRVDRPPRPAVWLYRHLGGGILPVDGDGRPYRFVPNRSGPSAGHFREVTIRQAAWGASLPEHVEPIWYNHPSQPRWAMEDDGFDDAYADDDPAEDSPASGTPYRSGVRPSRAHLRLVADL